MMKRLIIIVSVLLPAIVLAFVGFWIFTAKYPKQMTVTVEYISICKDTAYLGNEIRYKVIFSTYADLDSLAAAIGRPLAILGILSNEKSISPRNADYYFMSYITICDTAKKLFSAEIDKYITNDGKTIEISPGELHELISDKEYIEAYLMGIGYFQREYLSRKPVLIPVKDIINL